MNGQTLPRRVCRTLDSRGMLTVSWDGVWDLA